MLKDFWKINNKLIMDINYFDNPFYQIQKFQQGAFQQAWNKARLNKNRYFWFNGKTYNTKKSGESDQWWANHFKDNSTTGGASNVQTDVGLTAGWQGHKGANIGRYNSKGKWIRMKTNTGYHGKTVLGDRGDDVRQSDTRVFGRMDRPNENIVTKKGTNKRFNPLIQKLKFQQVLLIHIYRDLCLVVIL